MFVAPYFLVCVIPILSSLLTSLQLHSFSTEVRRRQALFNFSSTHTIHYSMCSLLPSAQPSAPPLKDFGRQNGTSLTWTVDQPAGTSLRLMLRDSTGSVAQSAPFTVTASRTSHISFNLLTDLLIRFLLISRHELPLQHLRFGYACRKHHHYPFDYHYDTYPDSRCWNFPFFHQSRVWSMVNQQPCRSLGSSWYHRCHLCLK